VTIVIASIHPADVCLGDGPGSAGRTKLSEHGGKAARAKPDPGSAAPRQEITFVPERDIKRLVTLEKLSGRHRQHRQLRQEVSVRRGGRRAGVRAPNARALSLANNIDTLVMRSA
jgi:hypothetical protein